MFEAGEEMHWPRENFNNIGNALVTIFIVILGEDWHVIMYMFSKVKTEDGRSMQIISIVLFSSAMVIGNIIFLTLFTAILLQKFNED